MQRMNLASKQVHIFHANKPFTFELESYCQGTCNNFPEANQVSPGKAIRPLQVKDPFNLDNAGSLFTGQLCLILKSSN